MNRGRWLVPALSVVVGCGAPTPIDDAGVDVVEPDAFFPFPDAFSPPLDAIVVDDFICSGEPVPLDLECVTQDLRTTSACGARGHYVFDGELCQRPEGAECGGETGAFDTLEDCAVTCARAGHCGLVLLSVGPGEPSLVNCAEAPATDCTFIGPQTGTTIPEGCSIWGPLGVYQARGDPRVTGEHPNASLLLASLSLSPTLGASCAVP